MIKNEDLFFEIGRNTDKISISGNANVANNRTLFKVKTCDDSNHKLKARVALHGNKDSLIKQLLTDCKICTPSCIKIF